MIQINKYANKVLLYMIIAFFTYTLSHKLLDIQSFTLNLYKTGLFSTEYIDSVVYFISTIEVLSIILLIFNERIGLLYSIGMMSVFTIYITGLNLLERYEVCGCGGVLNGLPFIYHFIINCIVIIVLVFVFRNNER